MKKINNRVLTALFIVIIVGVVYYYQEIRVVEQEIKKIPVIVTTADIPENTIIEESMVTTEERYVEDQQKEKGYITSHLDKVVGKRTKVPLYKGETVKLKRLMDDEKYMKYYDDTNKKITYFSLRKEDKAINFKEGGFIDIWLEPNELGHELLKTSEKIFEKVKIIDIKDDKYMTLNSVPEAYIPSYIGVAISDKDIKNVLDVFNEQYYEFKITAYGENLNYEIKTELIEKAKNEHSEEKHTDEIKTEISNENKPNNN